MPSSGRTGSGSSRASSSTLSTLFVVAVTVGLAVGGVAGTFLVVKPHQPIAPNVVFDHAFVENGTADTLSITHSGGDAIDGGRLYVLVHDADPSGTDDDYVWNGPALRGHDRVTAGSTVALNATRVGADGRLDLSRARVTLVWRELGRNLSATVATWEGPDRGRSTATETPVPEAEAVSRVGGSLKVAPGDESVLTFEVQTTGAATVTDFRVDIDDPGLSFGDLERPGDEFHVEDSGGNRIGGADASSYALGVTHPLTTAASLGAETSATITVGRFTESDGDPYEFDDDTDLWFTDEPSAADVTVTLAFADGTERALYIRLVEDD